jgi:flagellar hook-associated protein 2
MAAVTFSGFNNIDFNTVLNAVMQQERQPLVALQTKRSALDSQKTAFATLATKLAALDGAAAALADVQAFGQKSATASDSTVVTVAAGASTPAGSYDVVVNQLARGQVTTSATTYADKDTTVVATGGTLTIGGVPITITGDVTLQGLADAINSSDASPATASIVAAAGQYQLVLTGKQTGLSSAFTIANALTGGAGIAFSAASAVEASDADLLVNNVRVTSATNTVDGAVPGATLTLLRQTTSPVTVTVGRDLSSTRSALQSFVGAYNDLLQFFSDQGASAAKGDTSSIARDSVVRSLQASLREALGRQYGATGSFQYLSQVGLGFDRTGKLTFDQAAFDAATARLGDLQSFVSGKAGAFSAIQSVIDGYVGSDGLVPGAQTRIGDQMSRLDRRISDMEAQLAIRQQSLQQQYAAADAVMTQLNSQVSSLSSLSSVYKLF